MDNNVAVPTQHNVAGSCTYFSALLITHNLLHSEIHPMLTFFRLPSKSFDVADLMKVVKLVGPSNRLGPVTSQQSAFAPWIFLCYF